MWLSVDDVEDALLGVGLASDWTTGVAAYEAVAAGRAENLRLGHVVIVDAGNDSEPARDTWRRAAEDASASLVFVLLTPPDERDIGFAWKTVTAPIASIRAEPGSRCRRAHKGMALARSAGVDRQWPTA